MKNENIEELLEKRIDENNMADEEALQECPICGEASEGAMDCGCYAEIHYGKD